MLYYNNNVVGGVCSPATPPVYSNDNLVYGAGGVVVQPPTLQFTNVVQRENNEVRLFQLDLGPQKEKTPPQEVSLPGFGGLFKPEPEEVNLVTIGSSLELHSEIEFIDRPNFKESTQRTYPTSYQYPIGYGNVHKYPTQMAPQSNDISPMLLTPMDKAKMAGVPCREEINPDGTKSLVTEGLLNKLMAEKSAQNGSAQFVNPADMNRQVFGQVMQPQQYMNYNQQSSLGLRASAYVAHYTSPDEIMQMYNAQGINPLEINYRLPVPTDYRGVPIPVNPTIISESDLEAEMRNRGFRVGQKRQKPTTFLQANPQFSPQYNPMDDPQIPDRFKRIMAQEAPKPKTDDGVIHIGMKEFNEFRKIGAMVDDMVSSYAQASRQMQEENERNIPIGQLVNKPPQVDIPSDGFDPSCVGKAFNPEPVQQGFVSIGGYGGAYSNPFQAAQVRLQNQNLIRQDMQRECGVLQALFRASSNFLGEEIDDESMSYYTPSNYFGVEGDSEDDDHILTQEEYDKKKLEVYLDMHRQNIAFIEAQKCGPWYDQHQAWYLQKAAELERKHKQEIPDSVGMLEFFEKYAGKLVQEYDMYVASQNQNDLSNKFNGEAYRNYLTKDFQGGSIGFGQRILDPACMDDKEVSLPIYTEEELRNRKLAFINAVKNIGKGRD